MSSLGCGGGTIPKKNDLRVGIKSRLLGVAGTIPITRANGWY